MKKLKKRFIVPAVVFILGMCALIGAIYVVGESQKQQNRWSRIQRVPRKSCAIPCFWEKIRGCNRKR